ncbi:MAG: four helix bundle protein [Selenomonadaceae bacterium]|nr:four helix bundle protein [Selenomonadaceae bacterium]
MNTCKDLIVWQKSMKLFVEVYKLVKLLPKEETYALSDQMRRAVVSIPSNIAEGFGRNSTREYIQFLSIARGSCFELDTQIQGCLLIEYFTEKNAKVSLDLLDEIGRMLSAMINKLKSNH